MAFTSNELPGVQLANWNGPVPTGFFASVPAAIALVESIARLSVVSAESTAVSGRESWSFTAYGPTGTIFVTVEMNDAEASAVFGFFARLSEATTFAEVNVVPSWNVTSLRSWQRQRLVAVAELPARRQVGRDLELARCTARACRRSGRAPGSRGSS